VEFALPSLATAENIHLLEIAASVAAKALERHCFPRLLQIRAEQFAIRELMPDTAHAFTVPETLKSIPSDLFEPTFDISAVPESTLLDIGFAVFNKFGLMHSLRLSASALYLFLTRLRKKAGSLFRHALDVAVFAATTVVTTGLDDSVSRSELLALLLAAFCHDLDIGFFSEEIASRVPQGTDVIYGRQSVLEGHSCFEAITLVCQQDIGLLNSFQDSEIDDLIAAMCQLILGTDSQKHFELIQEARTAAKGQFSLEDDDQRLLLLKLVLKCADMGAIARPPEVAQKSLQFVCEDFLKRGPIQKLAGIVYGSSLVQNRQSIDVSRSTPTVFASVIQPTFNTLLQFLPKMADFAKQVRENGQTWWPNGIPDEEAPQLPPDRLMEMP
jgi:hypothetical protein